MRRPWRRCGEAMSWRHVYHASHATFKSACAGATCWNAAATVRNAGTPGTAGVPPAPLSFPQAGGTPAVPGGSRGGSMTTITAETAPRSSFREVWLISAGHMMTHWYPATFYLLLPLIGNELGLSFSQIGSILTFQFAAGALSNLPGGMLVDTIGRKGLLMAAALSWVGPAYPVIGLFHNHLMLVVFAALVRLRHQLWD